MKLEERISDEVEKLAPEIYKDLIKPAAQEVGSVAGRSARVLLSPVRGFLWGWEKIEELIIDGVNRRIEGIPKEQLKTPAPEIAVPLIQSLSYTVQNESLREMYLNLLANSMNAAMDKSVHPSFVEIIRKMNALDAKVFDKLSDVRGYQKVINPQISILHLKKVFIGVTPEWFIGWKVAGHDIFEVSSSLIRLSKFGLIELMFDRTAGDGSYESLKKHPELLSILNEHQKSSPGSELGIVETESILYVNEYGQQFKAVCK